MKFKPNDIILYDYSYRKIKCKALLKVIGTNDLGTDYFIMVLKEMKGSFKSGLVPYKDIDTYSSKAKKQALILYAPTNP